jgi:hypothetical protein
MFRRALFPALCQEDDAKGCLKIAAMCITEKKGNRPRDLEARLIFGRELQGHGVDTLVTMFPLSYR